MQAIVFYTPGQAADEPDAAIPGWYQLNLNHDQAHVELSCVSKTFDGCRLPILAFSNDSIGG